MDKQIHVFTWVNTFLQQQNKFIVIMVRELVGISKLPLQVFNKLFLVITVTAEQFLH